MLRNIQEINSEKIHPDCFEILKMATLRYTFLDIPLTSNFNRGLIFEKCFFTMIGQQHWPTNSIQTADVDASEMIFF